VSTAQFDFNDGAYRKGVGDHMNRLELRQLAEDRAIDAEALLNANRWSAAYYLIGYAVECGLKACILARVEQTGIIFTEKKFAEKCWTHDIEELVSTADLQAARGQDIANNPPLGQNWLVVKDWDETTRYRQMTEPQARGLYEAVTHNANGVLPWIRVRW